MSKKRKLRNESYLDKELKDFCIRHGVELFGFEVKLNDIDPIFGIDLLAKHDPTIGIELERAGCVYSFWDDPEGYQYKMEYDFKHINMEIDRKGHFFQEYHLKFPEEPESDWNPIVHNLSYTKNLFYRTAFHFHQGILVPNEVVRDSEKTHLRWKTVRNNFSNEEEHWASWKKEDTITFNYLNGKMVKETDDISTHLPPISEDKFKFLQKEKKRIKVEAKKKEKAEKAEAKAKAAAIEAAKGRKFMLLERRDIARHTIPMGPGGWTEVLRKTHKKETYDMFGIPQYETDLDGYIKSHPILTSTSNRDLVPEFLIKYIREK